ncbi:MAG: DNA polymerase [candidate division FCPU426 bacterium]
MPWGEKPHYYAFGHVSGNNCSWGQAQKALTKAYKCPDGILTQAGKFDIDLAETHMELPRLPWDKYHDTLFLLFLDDPNQNRLDLKSSAQRLLNMKPGERDEVAEWLVKNQPVPGVKISNSKDKKNPNFYMRYLAHAPAELVGKYANGDVIRTQRLYKLLYPRTVQRGMLEAYNRERRLMPHLLDIERQGVPVDLKRLRSDVKNYNKVLDTMTAWIMKHLKAPEGAKLSGVQLANLLINAEKVDEGALGLTKKGKPKTSKDALAGAITDKRLLAMLKYRTQLGTCLHTFMEPWLLTAEKSQGFIYTWWNQVKGSDAGARTGRLSSTPNFQNIPQEFTPAFHHEAPKLKLPKCPLGALPPLPMVRSYIVPFPGHVLIDRDYSQQEPRILAHFEGGALMEQYQADPWIDFHDNAKAQIERATGRTYSRKAIKTINLGLIYGMGIAKMAAAIGISYQETKDLKDLILSMYAGLKSMQSAMKLRAASKKPIRSWGGRESFCEAPRFDEETNQMRTFDYKMVNTLVQGSAGDCTKEATIRYMDAKPKTHKMLLTVHDETLASVPKAEAAKGMEVMRHAMESVEFDVQMLSEGKASPINWARLKDWDKKGVRVK